MGEAPEGEKLQKILARAGLGSRRGMEAAIEAGRVKLNGKLATIGDRAIVSDQVQLDGRPIKLDSNSARIILYNKPEGEICTRKDEKGRRTVFASLPKLTGQRWINVGRLDINTSGLILFTTDGELANKLMHPSTEIDREYLVRVFGEVTEDKLDSLRSGVELEDGPAKFTDISEKENEGAINRWFTVCLREGRNREVRRLWESQDLKVNRLKRVRYGPIFLPSIVRAGQWLDLDASDIKILYKMCGLSVPKLSARNPKERTRMQRQEQKLRSRGRTS